MEELSMNAWPALQTIVFDGWILRFSDGYTRRANGIYPLYPSSRSLEGKIALCESLYRGRGLSTIFKLTEASEPRDLERVLVGHGYVAEARTSVQVADLKPRARGVGIEVVNEWERTDEWRDAFHRMNHVALERQPIHDRILASILLPTCFASVRQDGQIAGCALGVVQDGWLGIFDVVVDEGQRRQGLGGRLMQGLLAWGREIGAERAYLQVMLSNAPALSLYEKLGFREAYQYWYRVDHPAEDAGHGSPMTESGRERPSKMEEGAKVNSVQPGIGYGFSYQATRGGAVLIQRSGRIVTHLRHETARAFLAEVDGVDEADAQETMARYTGNYRRGNERLADQHPRHQTPRDA